MTKKMTTEEFIRKVRDAHGDKYDYSKVEYVNAKTKVCIICPEHGEFWQQPSNHLQGQGCPKCTHPNANMTTEDFIIKAKQIHGDKYDYSKVEYVNSSTKVCIICPIHGEFWQQPIDHINGKGCPKCVGKYQTTEDFIIKAKQIHGDKYNYSKVDYINMETKVCIICPEHGEFRQTPHNHLKGQGCPKCVGKYQTTEEFIRKAKEIHGGKYDYSKTECVDNNTKVCIICPEHGEFWQKPYNHLKGQGCPKCKGNKIWETRGRITTEEFIRKAKEIHGGKYDYSKVEYTNANTKVCIICPEHGEFWQTPSSHLSGQGCPKCAHPNANMTTEDFIIKAKQIHGDKYDYSKVEYVNSSTKVCIICPIHGEFFVRANNHLRGIGCPNCQGLRKQYKFNLLEEFENEYAFRAFLTNSDINILTLILQNIEPKYEPIKRDIQRALVYANETDPIQSLREKYSSETDVSDDIETIEITDTHIDDTLDWDNDDIVNDMISQESDTTNNIDNELSMSDIIRNDEEEIKVINRLDDEHLITPEVREYIMAKYLNDRRRAWMANRDNK